MRDKRQANRRVTGLLSTAVVCLAMVGLMAPVASGAEGDKLRALNPPGAQFGVSVAADAQRVYYTNFNGNVLYSVNKDGTDEQTVPITGTTGGEGINAFSYDAGRDQFWAAGANTGRNIYLMDKTGAAVPKFTITDTPGNCDNGFGCLTLIDGLSYNGFDDTVHWSPDASQRVYKYGLDGTLVSFFDVNDAPNDTAEQCGFNYSSGIATVSATELYNVADGCQFIFRYSDTGTKQSFFAYDGQRGEDAECDDQEFPVTAIWVRDVDGSIEAFEVSGECPLGGGGGPGPPANVALDPAADVNRVDEEHCVTATVTDESGQPVPGVVVRFDVSGANTASGEATTDENGQAKFCYTGPFPGQDTITAFADTDGDGQQDADEPSGQATKTYVLPASTEGCKITDGGRIQAANGDRATFGGNAQVKGAPKGHQTYQDHGPAQALDIKSINILAVSCSADRRQGSIFGTATVNGLGSFDFRVDVKDNGEPGTTDTYRIRVNTIGYDSGQQVLVGGNIQIHK